MTKPKRTPTILALLIGVMLASAYLIVAKNGPMRGTGREIPAGMLH